VSLLSGYGSICFSYKDGWDVIDEVDKKKNIACDNHAKSPVNMQIDQILGTQRRKTLEMR